MGVDARVMNKGLWVVGLGLLANAGVMLFRGGAGGGADIVLDRAAFGQAAAGGGGQAGQLLGARGIYMMPAQIGPNAYGLYLMDVDSGTICVYKTTPESNRFRLMAARTYKYDRFLEDFNNEPLHPSEVKKMVEGQMQRQQLQEKDGVPTVDQVGKPDENLPTPAIVPGKGGAGEPKGGMAPGPAKIETPVPKDLTTITVTPAEDMPKGEAPKLDVPTITVTPVPEDGGK